jgi:anti-sigma regulatory factor (Ser/Thr protein kinase)
MADATHISFTASDRSYFSLLKKEIHNKSVELGFSEQKTAELDIVVSEMTSNLHKYANDGEILMGAFAEDENPYIEVICIDNGPGMADPFKMMKDGFSTTNSMGHGLGSINRLSDKFDIYTQKGWGTIILSRIYKNPVTRKLTRATGVDIKALVVAKPGEQHSGDGFYYKYEGGKFKMLVADGLGHGIEANYAVNQAAETFKNYTGSSPVEVLRIMHHDIRKTRGIVGTAVVFDFESNKWQIAGIGNIAVKMLGASNMKSYIAYNGIIGHNIPNTMNDQEHSWNDYYQIVLCSDGIRSRWDVSKYPGIFKCDLSVTAAAIYKDFARRTDDMSVIVGKIQPR